MFLTADRARNENKTNSSSSLYIQNSLKILYTPLTNLTLSIVKKANKTFDSVGLIVALADQVANCSDFFLQRFPPDSFGQVESVQQFIHLVYTDFSGPFNADSE